MKDFLSAIDREIPAKRFLGAFLALILALSLLAAGAMYFADPWMYYRVNEDSDFWLDGNYVAAGFIRNREYDSAVIGSSYFQDFRMQWFRDELQVEPINLTVPGLDNNEVQTVVDALAREGKAKTAYICFTYYEFENNINKGRLPTYLLDDTIWNDYNYLFSYEAWTKFIPLNAATWMLNKLNIHALDSYSSMRDIDALGNELQRFTFSADEVWQQNRLLPNQKLTEDEAGQLLDKMIANFEQYMAGLNLNGKEINVSFVLPPYSGLYWYMQQLTGRYSVYQEFEAYVVNYLDSIDNATLVDCHTLDEILDLDHYRDATHFDLTLQKKIVDILADGNRALTKNNLYEKQERLTQLVADFETTIPSDIEIPGI